MITGFRFALAGGAAAEFSGAVLALCLVRPGSATHNATWGRGRSIKAEKCPARWPGILVGHPGRPAVTP